MQKAVVTLLYVGEFGKRCTPGSGEYGKRENGGFGVLARERKGFVGCVWSLFLLSMHPEVVDDDSWMGRWDLHEHTDD